MAEQTGRSLRLTAEQQANANTALSKFGTKADLAAALGISRTTINKFFKGEFVLIKKFHVIRKKLKLDWQPEPSILSQFNAANADVAELRLQNSSTLEFRITSQFDAVNADVAELRQEVRSLSAQIKTLITTQEETKPLTEQEQQIQREQHRQAEERRIQLYQTKGRYSITDIGTLGGTESQAWAINKLGQVVGWSYLEGNESYHAFLWDSEKGIRDLNPPGFENSSANDINELGQIVIGTEGGNGRAFLWDNGNLIDMGTLGGSRTFPYGINNSGQVTGYSTTDSDKEEHPFLWENGKMTDLGTFPGNVQSVALDINNLGQVVGQGRVVPNEASHAFLWSKDDGMQDLGAINGCPSGGAFGINDNGQIIGYFIFGKTQFHFFLWENSKFKKPGIGQAYSINNNRQIVGRDGLDGKAFIWESGVQISLNELIPSNPEWDLTWARDVNDAGQIVGLGTINGETHAFLLNPV